MTERRLIGAHLIGMLDEAGYLTADLDQIAASLGVPLDLILEVLHELQTFDPPGVFARDLRECLSLQLKEKDRLDPLDPAAKLSLDRELLASFPEGYRHLAYAQTRIGFTVKRDMPQLKGPEVERLYARWQELEAKRG